MAEWILDHPEVVLAIAVVPIASWLVHEFRRVYQQSKEQSDELRTRMDKSDRKMEEHLREGVGVHRALERNATNMKNLEKAFDRLREELQRHNENGGRHGKA